jgi:hypothetical protein
MHLVSLASFRDLEWVLYHLSHGQPSAGALALRRLCDAGQAAQELEPALSLSLAACWLRSGDVNQARQLLADLRKRDAPRRVTIGGREVSLPSDDSQAIDWLSFTDKPWKAGPTTDAPAAKSP